MMKLSVSSVLVALTALSVHPLVQGRALPAAVCANDRCSELSAFSKRSDGTAFAHIGARADGDPESDSPLSDPMSVDTPEPAPAPAAAPAPAHGSDSDSPLSDPPPSSNQGGSRSSPGQSDNSMISATSSGDHGSQGDNEVENPNRDAADPSENDPYADKGVQYYLNKATQVDNFWNSAPAGQDKSNYQQLLATYKKNYQNGNPENTYDISSAITGPNDKTMAGLALAGINTKAKLKDYETGPKGGAADSDAYNNAYGFRNGPNKDKFFMLALDQMAQKDTNTGNSKLYWNEIVAVELLDAAPMVAKNSPTSSNFAAGGVVNRHAIANEGTTNRMDEILSGRGISPNDYQPLDAPNSAGTKVELTPADGQDWDKMIGTDNVSPIVRVFGTLKNSIGEWNCSLFVGLWPRTLTL